MQVCQRWNAEKSHLYKIDVLLEGKSQIIYPVLQKLSILVLPFCLPQKNNFPNVSRDAQIKCRNSARARELPNI